ncbi:MAG: TetR family transcriptional regulator [Erysipelotrichaceae bacterium]|nr:TetR family transcriptional regulator [Erysipelotrichaceae bacterium]
MTTEKTKLLIADAIRELMKHQPLDKIRTSDICSLAHIQRTTFYYHFKDKYDLVAWVFFHSFQDVDILNVDSAAQHMEQMKKDLLFYKRAYEDFSQNSFLEYLVEYFIAAYTAVAKEKLGVDSLEPQLSFSIRLYCYGAIYTAKEWVLHDNKTSAKDRIKMMFASMPASLQKIYFHQS